jgi:hypothetical protein
MSNPEQPPGWVYTASPPVTWDGLPLNPLAEDADGVLCVVEDVTGWHDTPDYDGHDTPLVLADGSLTGPKTAAARTVVISGSVVGPAPALALFRDQLVVRAAALVPAILYIPDAAGRYMEASVRCDSDGLKHAFVGPGLFTYQITLTAADPRKYGGASDVNMVPQAPGSGWRYDQPSAGSHTTLVRKYQRHYADTVLGNTATLANAGNVPAPVLLTYIGDLGPSRLVDDATGDTIYVAAVPDQQQITVNSETLNAYAAGGATRAAYVLPASVPLMVPALSSASWTLYATGAGEIWLHWQPAWQ